MTARHNESLQILGIDAAVDPRNTGLAIGRFSDGRWRIDSLETGRKETPIAEQVLPLLNPSSPVVVAIDAPMGWPIAFSRNVSAHQAGEQVDSDTRLLFARETDRVVHRETGLTPLSVSADRIARTAVAALGIVHELRETLRRGWASTQLGFSTFENQYGKVKHRHNGKGP